MMAQPGLPVHLFSELEAVKQAGNRGMAQGGPKVTHKFSSLAHQQAGSEEERGSVQNGARRLAVRVAGHPPVCGQST